MKMMNLSKWAICLSIFGVLTVVGCKKENSSNTSQLDETEATMVSSESDEESDAIDETIFDDVMGVNDEVGVGGTGMFGRSTTSDEGLVNGRSVDSFRCATVTITPQVGWPKTVTIDFGNGCNGPGGNTRKGKIIIVYTGRLMAPGSKATTTFDNYYVNNTHVEGTNIVENQSTFAERKFLKRWIAGKFTKPNGNYHEWDSYKVVTQIQGTLTPFPLDDVFSITGFSNGTVKHNNRLIQWSKEITQPLIRRFTCRWIVKGEVRIRRNNNPVAVLNYDAPNNGDCDNKAALTVNGNTSIITLH
jgi:hypothetical protein